MGTVKPGFLNYLIRFFQILYSVYGILWFLLIMFMIVPLVLLIALFKTDTREASVMKLAHLWADFWLLLVGIRHVSIVEQPLQEHTSYIFVSNHNSYMDIPEILKAIRIPLRVLGKAETGKIPLFGWIYNAAVVPVKRDSAEGRAQSLNMLRTVLQKNVSIYIAPEGTFNMTRQPLMKFYDGAFRLAIETQTPVKPMLFLDAASRLHWSSIFSLTPGVLRTVYLPEVSPAGYSIDQLDLFKQEVYDLMERKLIEYKASWILNHAACSAS